MSGRDDVTSDDWTRFWTQAQDQVWESWRSLITQQAPGADAPPDHLWRLWSDGLERFWQGRAPHLDGVNQEVFTRLLEQGKGFFFLSHRMLQAFEQMQRCGGEGAEWKPVLRRYVDQAQEQLRQWAGASTGQAALWGLPAEMWERLAAALAFTPGDWMQTLKSAGWIDEARAGGKERTQEWPAPGMTREWQLRLQEGTRRSEAYRDAWQVYAAQLVEVGVLALEYLYERLVVAGDRGRPLTALRELYDLWVECAEQAYAEIVATRAFALSQAEVINAAVALKRHLQDTLELTANAHNLPTRSELDTAHRSIKEMRDELERMRRQLNRQAAPGARKKKTKRQ